MKRRGPIRLPAQSALVAFESVSRLGSFSRAAEELGTSQPAISRHIATLEKQLGVQLLDRKRLGAELTDAGRRFRDGVIAGFHTIQAATDEARGRAREEEVVIASAHEAADLIVLPRYDALQEALGERVRIRIVTYFGHHENLSPYPVPDIVLSWDAPESAPEDRVTVMREAAQPVCSPWYAEAHRDTLAGPVTGWGELTFLFTFERTEHCADWDDWFEIAGRPGPEPVIERYEYDANVLEAAAVGRGIALGWRGYVERLIAAGTLVTPTDECIEFANTYEAVLTVAGRESDVARRCLGFFEGLF